MTSRFLAIFLLGLLVTAAGAAEVKFEKVTDGVYVHIGEVTLLRWL
jgi:hypothetical protein